MIKEIINIDLNKCSGCGLCVSDCVRQRLFLSDKKAAVNENIPCMECSHCISICPENAIIMLGYDNNEAKEYNSEEFDIQSEKLLNFIKFRRSIRHFKSDKVDLEMVKEAIEGGRFTPTAANRQNIRYIILNDTLPEFREKSLKTLNDISLNNVGAENVSNIDVYRNKWISNYNEYLHDNKDKMFFNAPLVILVVGSNLSSGWVELNAGLASTSVELMLNAKGLGACYIGFFGIAAEISPDINSELGLNPDEGIISTIAVGYPAIEYKRTALRKPTKINVL